MLGKKYKNFKLSNLTSVVLACGCPMCLLVGGVAPWGGVT